MLRLEDLNAPGIRAAMLTEIQADKERNILYISGRLSPRGVRDYPDLLKEAASEHDDSWLSQQLAQHGRLNEMEEYRTKNGTFMRKVSRNASETLAEGEFNRFYIRGLCVAALSATTDSELEVYRAKEVSNPRPESERLIGTRVRATQLLADLRQNIALDTVLGVPAGPNSGLSIRSIRA